MLDTPTTKAQREAFATWPEDKRQRATALANRMYDGTRTVSRCWTIAFAAVRFADELAASGARIGEVVDEMLPCEVAQ